MRNFHINGYIFHVQCCVVLHCIRKMFLLASDREIHGDVQLGKQSSKKY